MSCVKITDSIRDYASNFSEETPESMANILGMFWEQFPDRSGEFPSEREMQRYIHHTRKVEDLTVTYNLPGQGKQSYTVKGTHIFNSKGKEVFKTEGRHRNKIFANVDYKIKNAVIVTHNNKDYVVDKFGNITSVTTGNIMQWEDTNGDRKAILALADTEFNTVTKKTNNRDNSYTLHSGGARGSDTYFSTIGEKYGVRANHYYDGEKTPNGNTQISENDRIEGQQKVTQAAKFMYGLKGTVRDPRLIRNWVQVKYADEVIAVGEFIEPGEKLHPEKSNDNRTALIKQVKGGTGYAVQMAVMEGKPVYVFDQKEGKWYTFKANTSENELITPTIVDNSPLSFKMSYSYKSERAFGVKATNTFDAIKSGERTATTRYVKDGNIERWKQAKVGDILEFDNGNGETLYTRVTKEATQLSKDTSASEWSKKEGWNTEHFNKKVKPEIEKGEAYQIEFEYISPEEINESWGEWVETDAPILTQNFAGIGTRGLNPEGKKAIEQVYEKTFGPIKNTRTPKFSWGRTAPNSYEVSSKGDKRFSALFAKFKEGTVIDGVDVSNMTIEHVYQNIIKKSGKGRAPATNSKLYNPSLTTKEEQEDFSYNEGYLPLWQLWAEQNPELIEELRSKASGKVLTDMFANTKVSQARALSDILNNSSENNSLPNKKFDSSEELLSEDDNNPFDQSPIATIEDIESVDLVFDPQVRRDRVTLIARLFRQKITTALKEKEDAINNRMNNPNLSEEERDDLRKELRSLDRWSIIKAETPAGLFERVLNDTFKRYLNDTEEEKIQTELGELNKRKGIEKYSEEQKRAAAKKLADYRTKEYQKIVDHFYTLADEASSILLFHEKIAIDPNSLAVEEGVIESDDPEGNSQTEDYNNNAQENGTVKDGWMTNFRLVSSHEALSQAVRAIISEIPKLDYRGRFEKDDLGNPRYLDADYVHAALMDKLRYMITAEDMIPLLQDLAKQKPWVNQLIELLQKDDSLYSQFYQDFRKDFVEYWIQKKIKNPDGTYNIQTININTPEGIYYLLDSWRDNYESGNQLDDDSVYNKNGSINKENAEKGLKIFNEINDLFQEATSTKEKIELLEKEEVWNSVLKMLHMVGISPNPSVLKATLFDIKESTSEVEYTDPIMLLLPQLQIIFKGIKNGEVRDEIKPDGEVKRGDLLNTFGGAYSSIAKMFSEVVEDAIESSVRENNKSYYSHVNPAYLGKLIKQLKNIRGNKEDFEAFIQEEFGQYEWFKKDGEWLNDWVKLLAEDPNMRKALQHKVVLNHDKKEYTDWDDLDYTIVLLNEYFAEPKGKFAWYHVPILSDSPSAEFIRFVKYKSGDQVDDNGNPMTFQDIITNKFINVINQEYDRIMLVRERFDMYKQGKGIVPIANYDMIENEETGEISIGGAEFKFIPELNDLTYDLIGEDGDIVSTETFLERFERLRNTPVELKEFLIDTIKEIMEEGFEKTYAEWESIGLLEELPNGKLKHLPYVGKSKQNAKTAEALLKARSILGEQFTQEMNMLRSKYLNNRAINDTQATRIFNEIKALLNRKVSEGKISTNEVSSIARELIVRDNTKDALREYYWNSKFATSQIIELTTTDLSFYINLEDFQKRYKEVHAPSLRLNTHAKFKGKNIGRQWERTIYIKDSIIASAVTDDVKEALDAKVANGEMTKAERDYIVSQFEGLSINVADAQAYRSISSYRAMMAMSGQWTEEMETAYEHLTQPGGKWTLEDFNIIWQTKKPYVYTQVNNDSGAEGHTGIKTPVQHKNSEYLLLALHDAIAGPLGKSGKLKAINDFMEKNQIDVVQFESTTKVGGQGAIDLSKVDTYEDTMRALGEVTEIASGNENPNVVHKVSYEDYGIQTATPEHSIDAFQLIGTQIRKLITADIDPSTLITVGNKTMTKQEWLDLYNAINTENIIQAFKEVDEIFQDPKEIERVLLEEIRGNSRYSRDLARACKLKDGVFDIPLYDPVQSQRVQQLLNSIIKSRVTKQKIRGGSLIQVSSYGLTDELQIVWEGTGKNKRVKYFECYMPAYSREFYEPLMDENGMLDVTKLPEDLRKLVGYRV